jgi:hypothetical protein
VVKTKKISENIYEIEKENNKIELKKIWEKYINIKFYRIMPTDQKKDTLKNGLNPLSDPYKKINPLIRRLYNLILKLEKKGIVFCDIWRSGPVKGSTIVKISLRSVNGKYVDFVGNKKQIQVYKKRWIGGGCLATHVLKFTNFLLENINYLNHSEKKLVKYLNDWANKSKNKKRFTIYVKGSSKYLESALFYCYVPEFKNYWKSPFGSFEHFQKFIKTHSLVKYMPYLKNEKLFYLRIINKLPQSEIKLLK